MEEQPGKNLVALGRLQGALIVEGRQRAEGTLAWEAFVDGLLAGQSPAAAAEARELVSEVVPGLVERGLLASPAALWDYLTAKVLRGIRAEPEALLGRWHPVGLSSDIPEPCDYLTARVVQEPVAAIRQEDGTVRAFLNVCPHRLAELLTGQGQVERGRIVCPYHGWCFDPAGACTNIPGQRRGEFGEAFEPGPWGLQEIRCREDGGRLHVAFGPEPQEPPVPPREEGAEPAARRIARLLHAVHPGYPKVRQPEVSDFVRFHLRLGRVAARLERESGPAERASLTLELRQCLLDTGWNGDAWAAPLSGPGLPADRSGRPAMLPKDVDEATPPPGSRALPPWIYGDPELFVSEAERLVKPTWQFVGHEKELPHPGDLTWLDFVGQRIYVMRRADGTLSAGVLRDLAARSLESDAEALASHLDPADLDLWNGFLFVRFPGDGPGVAEVWENEGLLAPYRIAAMEPLYGAGWYDFDVEVDYKILWENFLELYHFPIAHKSLSRICRVVPESDLMPLRAEPSPLCTPEERAYFDSLHASAPHDLEHEQALRRHADEHKELDEILHFTVFGSIPHPQRAPITLGITVFPDHLQAMSFIPIGPRECRIRIRSYGHPIDTSTERGRALAAAREANVGVLQIELVEEDIILNYLCEGGTGSRLFRSQGILAGLEVSVRNFQQSLRRVVPVAARVPRPPQGEVWRASFQPGGEDRPA